LRLPKSLRHAKENKPYGFILGFNKKEEVVYNLQDSSGKSGFYTSAIEFNDQLFLVSNVSNEINVYNLDKWYFFFKLVSKY